MLNFVPSIFLQKFPRTFAAGCRIGGNVYDSGMDVVTHIVLALHLLSMAAIVGIWLAHFKTPTVTGLQLIGACGSLLTGLLLTGFAEMSDDPVNHAKIGVKALLALVVLAAAIISTVKKRKGGEVSTGLAHATGGTALINVVVAALWQ